MRVFAVRGLLAWDAEWDLAKALEHVERALELQPNDAAAHIMYGQMLTWLQRFDEARRHLDEAGKLDPLLPPWYDISLMAWWQYRGQYEKVIQEGEQARTRNPTLWMIPCQMGFAHMFLAQPGQAASEFEAALNILRPARPPDVLAPLGLAYGQAGRGRDALRILTEMEQASRKRYISPYSLAEVHCGLGHMDEVFRLLDQALVGRTPALVTRMRYDPFTVALRHDRRWKPFLARLSQLVRLPPGTTIPYW